MSRIAPEPSPVATTSTEVWPDIFNNVNLVMPGWLIADMQERHEFGRKKYGVGLQVWNGRDAVVDAYQEALDLVVYTHQARMRLRALGLDAKDPNTRLALDLTFHNALQVARWLGELAQLKRVPTESEVRGG